MSLGGGSEKYNTTTGLCSEQVLLHVYDLGKQKFTRSFNAVVKSHGAFHSGVEVYGKEWAFGMVSDYVSTGVTWCSPRQHDQHTYRETILVGHTHLSSEEVSALLQAMSFAWMGHTYDVFTRNCHHFADELCVKLGVGHIPSWLNNLATSSGETVEFIETADSGFDGGQVFVDLLADVRNFMSRAIHGTENHLVNTTERSDDEDTRRY